MKECSSKWISWMFLAENVASDGFRRVENTAETKMLFFLNILIMIWARVDFSSAVSHERHQFGTQYLLSIIAYSWYFRNVWIIILLLLISISQAIYWYILQTFLMVSEMKQGKSMLYGTGGVLANQRKDQHIQRHWR